MLNTSFWSGRRVLITGHTGFKGSWLTLWLSQLGAEVWGYSLPPEDETTLFYELSLCKAFGYVRHQYGDIRDVEALNQFVSQARPQTVFHLAAQPLVRKSYSDPLGTWSTNVQGSLNLMEALTFLSHDCSVVMVTTDKVYANNEWDYGYREEDRLGGLDPYSASKAAAELAISSWRQSFCGDAAHQTPYISIATARAGNVIGGGDWSIDRIVPDLIRSLNSGSSLPVRKPEATRPWQHVLEPLSGYLLLAESLATNGNEFCSAFNFGPTLDSNKSVKELINTAMNYWPGSWHCPKVFADPHEAGRLHLQIDKAYHQLGWKPLWSFPTTVERTINWYKAVCSGSSALDCCLCDLELYQEELANVS